MRATACACSACRRCFTRILQDERLFALGFCDGAGKLVYRTPTLPAGGRAAAGRAPPAEEAGRVLQQPSGPLHVGAHAGRWPTAGSSASC